jgi:hypothetical protein
MKIISNNLQEWADIILAEINADENVNDWYWPKTQHHQIFEQAWMKFVNRNLNYFSFENMIAQVREGNEFNLAFLKTLELCRYTRVLSPKHINSPFGRMCIWNLPPNTQLLPHKDNYFYHRFITRNIFIVSDNTDYSMIIKIDKEFAPSQKGSLWQFHPDKELHSFNNTSDRPFYFLGFDFWDEEKLVALQSLIDHKTLSEDVERMTTFGSLGKKSKFISNH